MRVIAGEFRGRKLSSPRTMGIRPTSDRVRESLFNILQGRCTDASVLDLFAGVGTFGIEALSRGASRVTFVDRSPQALQCLRRNTAFCRDSVDLVPVPVKQAISFFAKQQKTFDIIFLDPPYDEDWINSTVTLLNETDILNAEGLLIVQHSKRERLSMDWDHLEIYDTRVYGDTGISFMRRPS